MEGLEQALGTLKPSQTLILHLGNLGSRCQQCAGTGYMAPQSQIQISRMDMFQASCPSSEYTMTNHGGHPTKAEKIEIVNNNRITNYTSWRG